MIFVSGSRSSEGCRFPFSASQTAATAFPQARSASAVHLVAIALDAIARAGTSEELYEMFLQAIPDARGEVLDVVAERDKVVLVDRFAGTHRGLTPALLRLDPMFDPLHSDPRFQRLCEEKQP